VSISDAHVIHALATWDVAVDYARFVKVLDKKIQDWDSVAREKAKRYRYTHYSLLNEKLLLLEVRQLRKLPFVRDSLLRYKKQTILNEVYFSDNLSTRYWYNGDLSSNSIAYRIVKRDSTLNDMTTAMQMYFLMQRKKGSWNTYEASNVLMSILPDLISGGASKKVPASVSLSGKVNAQVQKFPFQAELTAGEALSIHKETGLPLYVMYYKEERVTKAQAGTDAFKIKTELNEKRLKAGKPSILKATVEVKRDATLEHVMIEIPIPGGCSYADKRQFENRIETHREYFKEKAVVFCENMSAGTYVFQVQLLPRFTGKYHVNPAQVSLMYFPVINANTDMEKVMIED
jgi:alpha-2-macroglobulin